MSEKRKTHYQINYEKMLNIIQNAIENKEEYILTNEMKPPFKRSGGFASNFYKKGMDAFRDILKNYDLVEERACKTFKSDECKERKLGTNTLIIILPQYRINLRNKTIDELLI